MKILFSFLDEKTKLKLIKYNKNLQKKLDINLINYKLFSGRYIIYDKNGKGKEYSYSGTLLFEGKYLNGKRNGKGKKYSYFVNKPTLKFEGEYLNGKRHGKGIEYYIDGDYLKFKGEYLYDKKWNGKGYDKKSNIIYELDNGNGKVKKSYRNGKLKFVGEYLNGLKNGYVKEYYYDGPLKFEGKYLNGKRNGKGKEYYYINYISGIKFEGEYLNGERNGKGIKYYPGGEKKFIGEYLNGKKYNGKGFDICGNMVYELKKGNGYIKEYYYGGEELEFEGEYLNGEINGKGKEYYN